MSNLPVQSRLKAPSSRIGKPSSVKVNDVVPRSGIKPPSSSSSPSFNETPQKTNIKQLKSRSADVNDKKQLSSTSLSPPSTTTPRITKPSQSKITKTTPVIGKRENIVSKKQSGSSTSLNKETEAPVFSREKTQESIKDAETGILFKIGDRVLVSGTKAGIIEYLGETKFAKGFWAGIKLDEATGKNNGSVAGIQYFECEPLHGVFSKVNRLHKINIVRDKKPSISDFKLDDNSLLKIGDSVIVSGTKMGFLRYLGPTEFAKGEWAGVELKEPLGKNDGAVAGTRYFTCEPNYGLFAPSAKVTKSKNKSVLPKTSNSVTTGTSLENAAKTMFNNRTGSLSSEISDIPTSPNNEKITSPEANKLTSPQSLKKTQTTSLQVAALQSALEEREREIRKMLTEREKSGKISDDANKENNIGHFETKIKEKNVTIQTLKNELQKLKAENSTILASLEEERKKYEDLQFMLEEEKITDAELKDHVEQDEGKIRELSEETKEKNKKITNLQRDLQEARSENIRNEAKILEMKDEIQQLHNLTNNVANDNENVVKLNKELNEVKEDLRKKNEQVNGLEMKLNGQVNHVNERDRLNGKLAQIEDEKENAVKECDRMKIEKEETLKELLQLKKEKNEVELKHKSTVEKLHFVEKQHKDLLKTNSVLVAKKEEAIKANNLSLNATILDLEDQVGKSKMKISVLETDIETATTEYQKKLQHSDKQLCETKRELNEQIEETNKKNEILKEMEEKLRMQITRQKEIENEVEHLDKADKSLALIKEAHSSEVDALQSKIATLTETIESLKKKQETIYIEHKNDLEQQETNKNEVVNKLKEKIAQLEGEKTVILEECSRLKQDKERFSNNLTQQQRDHEETKESCNKMSGELEELRRKCEQLSRTNEELSIERTDAIQLCEDQDEQLDVLKKEKEKAFLDCDHLSKEKDELSSKISSLQDEIKTLNSKCDVKQVEIEEAKESEIRILKDKLDEVMKEKETSVDSVSSLKGQTQCLEKDIQSKVVEINKLKTEQETLMLQSMELENQVNELKKVLIDENNSARSRVDSLETEISALKDDVEEANHLLKVKNEDIEGYKEQVGRSDVDNTNIEKLKGESIPKSPMDGDILENASTLLIRLHEAESKLSLLQSEKETAEEQVEFLNSVIVDLQNKNEKAKQTIALLEAGDDPVMLHGLDSDSDEEVVSKPKFAMRKFCDICDVFDEHDTDDCPLQSTGNDHSGDGGIQHHGSRSEKRPYCGICEAFGHWSEDCDDEQTF